MPSRTSPATPLPRILCLHGGGSNARIFRAQCRSLVTALRPHFRLVFADAPFLSSAGPCVQSVYSGEKEWGSYRRWLRWNSAQPEIEPGIAAAAIKGALLAAMDEDDRSGGTGAWIALLGFSQGAKIAASLLLHQQWRADSQRGYASLLAGDELLPSFRFAVLLAGRGPPVALDVGMAGELHLPDAAALSGVDTLYSEEDWIGARRYLLGIPTVHVHGLHDPGLSQHRLLLRCCSEESTRLVEWEGDHRVPLKSKDVGPVVDHILGFAEQTAHTNRLK